MVSKSQLQIHPRKNPAAFLQHSRAFSPLLLFPLWSRSFAPEISFCAVHIYFSLWLTTQSGWLQRPQAFLPASSISPRRLRQKKGFKSRGRGEVLTSRNKTFSLRTSLGMAWVVKGYMIPFQESSRTHTHPLKAIFRLLRNTAQRFLLQGIETLCEKQVICCAPHSPLNHAGFYTSMLLSQNETVQSAHALVSFPFPDEAVDALSHLWEFPG